MRIAKFLADTGAAPSRRAAEQMIADGRVAVNGAVLISPAFNISDADKISVNGKILTANHQLPTTIFAFHKPAGVMTTASDPAGRKTIYDILPQKYHNLKYIGRLDFNTSGLLLLTNSGELARKMTLPSAQIPRVYIAKLGRAWTMDDEMFNRITKKIRTGITVDGIHYRPMKLRRINASDTEITITEGKKNEIRLVFDSVGLPVRKLHRVSYGDIELGDLAVGNIRECKV
ncbi:MAG: rRNA pseudouridine synthase [Rickettsiales bacterium]|jgi:23S rRNA pseudouridine2605 synthase|nr:rRNA pseudouridine synthase [Rickettsiales bacterium]